MLFSPDLQELWRFDCNRNIHPKSNSIHNRLIDRASDLEMAMESDLSSGLVQLSIVNTNSPPGDCSRWQ